MAFLYFSGVALPSSTFPVWHGFPLLFWLATVVLVNIVVVVVVVVAAVVLGIIVIVVAFIDSLFPTLPVSNYQIPLKLLNTLTMASW